MSYLGNRPEYNRYIEEVAIVAAGLHHSAHSGLLLITEVTGKVIL